MRQNILKRLAYRTSTFVVLTLLIIAGLGFNLAAQADTLTITTPIDCNNNSVMYCGATSTAMIINKYNNGDTVNTAKSIQDIYSSFGITASDIHGMNGTVSTETIETGIVTKAGNVYDFNNKLIANNAMTAGRQNISGSQTKTVNGTTFYVRSPSVSFVSDNLRAFLVMINGQFKFAILASCGNPVIATPITPPAPKPKPTPVPPPVHSTTTTIKKTVNTCNGNTRNVNSGIASQGGNCSQNTTIVQAQAEPPQTPAAIGQCVSLSLDIVQANPLSVNVTANPATANGAQFTTATFDFGDGTITPPSNQLTASHTYASPGSKVITATLSFTSNGQTVPNATCQTEVTSVAPPVVAAAAVTTAPTPTPTVQQTAAPLPNTGPGDVIALFGASSFIGMIGYRVFLSRRI